MGKFFNPVEYFRQHKSTFITIGNLFPVLALVVLISNILIIKNVDEKIATKIVSFNMLFLGSIAIILLILSKIILSKSDYAKRTTKQKISTTLVFTFFLTSCCGYVWVYYMVLSFHPPLIIPPLLFTVWDIVRISFVGLLLMLFSSFAEFILALVKLLFPKLIPAISSFFKWFWHTKIWPAGCVSFHPNYPRIYWFHYQGKRYYQTVVQDFFRAYLNNIYAPICLILRPPKPFNLAKANDTSD